MKKIDQSPESFRLDSAAGQNSRIDQRSALWTDLALLWGYLVGTGGWLFSLLGISVYAPVLLGGAAVFSAAAVFLLHASGKTKRIGICILYLLLIFAAVLFFSGLRDGANGFLNQAIDTLGKRFPYLLPEYPVSIGEDSLQSVITLTCLWGVGILAVPGALLIQRGNRVFLSISLLFLLGAPAVLGIYPDLFWSAAAIFVLTAVWIRGHGEKLPFDRQLLAVTGTLGYLAVAAVLIFACMQLVFPVNGYEKNQAVKGILASFQKTVDQARYGGDEVPLPDGDFRKLGSFAPEGTPILEVTMSSPESYYLRGFTGGSYTGTGWEDTDAGARWKNKNLFYWLHAGGFYGQECLGKAAVALDSEVGAGQKNRITIQNLSGSSRYFYTPYEVLDEPEGASVLDLNGQKIGDEGILTPGGKGSRSYAYGALPNQVTRYPALAAKLLAEEELSGEGKKYAGQEEYYNQFVYDNYLDIPDDLKPVLTEMMGDYEIREGEKHAEYSDAKQNILYLLTSACTYSEIRQDAWDGTDFIREFLSLEKEGYSVHFASAAAMMFRYYGIPARYVEGYLITPEDAGAMNPDEPYLLDDTHAHAWAEYYQDGVGWLPFETTPSYLDVMAKADEYQDISGISSQSGQSQNEQDQQEEEPEQEEETPSFDWLLLLEIVFVAGICVFLFILLNFLVWVIYQRRKSKKARKLFSSEDRRLAVRSIFNYTMNILAVAGIRIRNVSLYRYGGAVGDMFDEETGKRFEEIVGIRQEAVYSSHEITEEQREQMLRFENEVWERVCKNGGPVQKFQLKYIYFL